MRNVRPVTITAGSQLLEAVLGPGHPALAPPAELVVGLLPGEGVGPELVAAAGRVLEAAAERHELRVRTVAGPATVEQAGLTPPVDAFLHDVFAHGGSVLAGAVGGRFVYDLRRRHDLFCKLVPVRPWAALEDVSPLRPERLAGVDLVVVRENVAGLYQGSSVRDGDRVEHTFAYTFEEVRRIVAVGAAIAARRRGRLAVVVKDGGLPAMSALWREAAAAACDPFGVLPVFVDVDLSAYQLLGAAADLDALVAPNLFGDVLADVSAALLGGRGVSFSGNYAPSGAAVYQTNHGAAFDLEGADAANPVGQFAALAMLLDARGAPGAAAAIRASVDAVWRAGWRTRDVARPGDRVVGTRELTDRVIATLERT